MTNKLKDPNTAPKTYWTILNVYSTIKKILAMPQLIVDGKFISDFFRESKPF